MLQEGMKAYDFTLSDQNGNLISLKDFRGQKVVVYFYPKDNTPGCNKQACKYRDEYEQFQKQNIVVLGISKDSISSHQKFATKFALPFPILSDPELEAIQGFGVWKEKKLYGKTFMGVVRSSFLIDEEGTIIKVIEKAKPDTNALDMLKFIE